MNKITVETTVSAPLATVWDAWTRPEHVIHWSFASDDWEANDAENDLRVGGSFKTALSAKDKSAGFDFEGVYTAVEEHKLITYKMADGREMEITFTQTPEGVKIVETFDPENENPEDMQRDGWQGFLNNFKKYTEELAKANNKTP